MRRAICSKISCWPVGTVWFRMAFADGGEVAEGHAGLMSERRCGDGQTRLAAIFKQGQVETERADNDGGFFFDEDCPGGEQ